MRGVAKDARGKVEDSARGKMNETRGRMESGRTVEPNRPAVARQAPRRPKWPIPLALLGLLGLALAAILASTGSNRELPTDFNAQRGLSGTAASLLDQQALQSGDFDGALQSDVDVDGQWTTRVVETSGDNARVLSERSLSVDGSALGTSSHFYAVNRQSMEPASGAPDSWDVTPHQGLVVGFPAGAEQRDYSGWVSDTQTTAPIRFVREEEREGMNTFVYQSDVPATPIRDQDVLSSMPSSLTRAQLQGLVASSDLPLADDQRQALTQALPGLPDQVPLNYTYQATTTYWVDPTSGQIIDLQQQQIRNATIGGPGGAVLANLPVFNVNTQFTPDAVTAAANQAESLGNTMGGGGRAWPWVLGTLGAIALLAGLLGLLARRRPAPAPAMPQGTQRPTDRMSTDRMSSDRTSNASNRGMTSGADATRRRAEEADATRKQRESQAGQPQGPYSGQSQHTGPYRGSSTTPTNEEEFPTRNQPGQYPGGKQPPKG